MVAKKPKRVGIGRELNLREADFIREYLANGGNASKAYRVAYNYRGRHSDTLYLRVLNRPRVKAAIDAARAASRAEISMEMKDRRRQLASIALHDGDSGIPTYGERIAAVREDAILAGERRTDGTQVNIGGDVSFSLVLASLRGESPSLTDNGAADVFELSAPGSARVHGVAGDPSTSVAEVGDHETSARPSRAPATVSSSSAGNGRAVLRGPLGSIVLEAEADDSQEALAAVPAAVAAPGPAPAAGAVVCLESDE